MITILDFVSGTTVIKNVPEGTEDLEQYIESLGYDIDSVQWMGNHSLQIDIS